MKNLNILTLALGLCAIQPMAQAAAGREPPVPVRTVAPDYPSSLRSQGVSGVVMVKCTIDEQGNVSETEVTKSSNETFDKFATAALKKWKFKPARQDGTPVAMQVTIPIKFVAEES
ncbi:MAG TPA: energy transducer TonB [Opitutus sp.]|nr:energy transducer TonB [Opitutus sp.]